MADYRSNGPCADFDNDDGGRRSNGRPHWDEIGTRNTVDRNNISLPYSPERESDRGHRHEQESLLDEFMSMENIHAEDFFPLPQMNYSHASSPPPPQTHRTRSWEGHDTIRGDHSQPPPTVRHRANAGPSDHYSMERGNTTGSTQYVGYGPPPVYSSSQSFEQYGISHAHSSTHAPHPHYAAPPPPHPHYVVSNGPVLSYPYATSVSGGAYYPPPWGPPPPPLQVIEYIRNIKSSDVLCGRGGATNSHSGNRSFRSLVKRHQDRYLKAKKRDKPSVAASIVELIRDRGGRFLRRLETNGAGQPQLHLGDILWVDIGDERAREKTCQALREGAPELRRRRSRGASSSSDEEDGEESPSQKRKLSSSFSEDDGEKEATTVNTTTTQTKCEYSSPKGPYHQQHRHHRRHRPDNGHDDVVVKTEFAPAACEPDVRDDFECLDRTDDKDVESPEEGPLVIRPCPRLMRRPVCDMAVSELSSREQQLYLNDFLPPHPNIRESSARRQRQVVLMARDYTSASSDNDDTEDASECWEV